MIIDVCKPGITSTLSNRRIHYISGPDLSIGLRKHSMVTLMFGQVVMGGEDFKVQGANH